MKVREVISEVEGDSSSGNLKVHWWSNGGRRRRAAAAEKEVVEAMVDGGGNGEKNVNF